MEPTYEDIVDLEQWFSKIAAEFQGEYDGWGCMAYVYDDELDEEESSLRNSWLCLYLNKKTPVLPGFFILYI